MEDHRESCEQTVQGSEDDDGELCDHPIKVLRCPRSPELKQKYTQKGYN